MRAPDRKAMMAKIETISVMINWSDKYCCPKGFSLRYLSINKKTKAVNAVMEKYIIMSETFIFGGRKVTFTFLKQLFEKLSFD
jgi:hypothetical protein